jgi:hypothetical protein
MGVRCVEEGNYSIRPFISPILNFEKFVASVPVRGINTTHTLFGKLMM